MASSCYTVSGQQWLDMALENEFWPLVHVLTPATMTFMFQLDFLQALSAIYVFETLEFIFESHALCIEAMTDRLVGDIIMGSLGILLAFRASNTATFKWNRNCMTIMRSVGSVLFVGGLPIALYVANISHYWYGHAIYGVVTCLFFLLLHQYMDMRRWCLTATALTTLVLFGRAVVPHTFVVVLVSASIIFMGSYL